MKVKVNIFERMLLRFNRVLFNLSFKIGDTIHRKYDREGVYNTRSYDESCGVMVFSNEEES